MTETKFAGPTMFSRGDTVHVSQHGALVARERSTAIRYPRAEATRRGLYASQLGEVRQWTAAELAGIGQLRHDWIMSDRTGVSPRFGQVKPGDDRGRVRPAAQGGTEDAGDRPAHGSTPMPPAYREAPERSLTSGRPVSSEK